MDKVLTHATLGVSSLLLSFGFINKVDKVISLS